MRRTARLESIGAAAAVLSMAVALVGGPAAAAPPTAITPMAPAPAVTVLTSDFEDGQVAPWGPRGSVDLTVTDELAHGGDRALLVSGADADWNGPATDALALLAPGAEYTITAWVRLAPGTEGSSDLHFTMETNAAETGYDWIGDPAPVTAEEWVQVGGSYTIADGLDEATLYLEAAPIGATQPDFLVDDVTITGPPTSGATSPLSTSFESDLGPWTARGDGTATLARTDTEARTGDHSALVTMRTNAWNGVGADVTDLFIEGTPYTISAWVKLPAGSTDSADLRLSIQRDRTGADTSYDTITTAPGVTATGWVEVSATYTMAAAERALLYLETVEGTGDFLVDDIVVTSPDQPVQLDIPSLNDELPWPVGVAIDERETTGAPAQLVTKHFDQITAENAMKPESIQPEEGTFTFAAADQLVDFALANDLRVYGHTLVWHSQTPDWFFTHADGTPLTDSPDDQALLRERMRTHIQTVADHFRDKYGEYGTPGNPIVAFDVVNEAIAENEADGLRRSPWYQVLGEDYLDLAFGYAEDAFGEDVLLFLNDYNTELPAKRQAMFDVASRLLDRGVGLDGLGHQFHVSLAQPVSQLQDSLDEFAELGLPQAVTELDVPIDGTVTEEKLVQQGYYYAEVFDLLRQYDLFSVTAWGPYDSRSWREGDPLLFDDYLQAKPAYWGIVDASQLPTLTQNLNVHRADDGAHLGPDALAWQLLPLAQAGDGAATGFQARWTPAGLTVYVQVADGTVDDGDLVEVFIGDQEPVRAPRGGAQLTGSTDAGAGTAADPVTTANAAGALAGHRARTPAIPMAVVTAETDAGYVVVLDVPMEAARGQAVDFDVRITDGATGEQVSWNDLTHHQEDGQRLGTLSLVEPLGFAQVPQATAPVTIDGVAEAVWDSAAVVATDVQVAGDPGASAQVRLLWTPEQLSLFFEVTDPVLDEASSNAWEQDSVEVFLDPDNAKAGPLRSVDGQYRVSFTNAVSISGELDTIGANLTSATAQTEAGYAVEIGLALDGAGAGDLLGAELQVNDAADGVRSSVRTWSDPTGRSYQDTSRWGVLQLVAAAEDPGDPGADPDPTEQPTGTPGAGAGDDGADNPAGDPGADEEGGAAGPAGDLPTTGTPGPWAAVLAAALMVATGLALRLRSRASER